MKILFIPVNSKISINKSKIILESKKLPKNIAIAYSIQYKSQAEQIKTILDKDSNINSFIQILGCLKPKFSKNTKAVLLISDGLFHAYSLAYEINLPVYILQDSKIIKIDKKQLNKINNPKKASYLNFLNSEKIGILISTKFGQENFKKAEIAKKQLKNKKSYLFLSNNINISEFENFSFIQSWINTACPKLDLESRKIINLRDLDLRN